MNPKASQKMHPVIKMNEKDKNREREKSEYQKEEADQVEEWSEPPNWLGGSFQFMKRKRKKKCEWEKGIVFNYKAWANETLSLTDKDGDSYSPTRLFRTSLARVPTLPLFSILSLSLSVLLYALRTRASSFFFVLLAVILYFYLHKLKYFVLVLRLRFSFR